jgi:4-hydroxy-tetrahydrodipicolinate synthase
VNATVELSGVWIPIVTPFREARVDHDALARLVARLSAQGVAGFVVCATTGEAPLLSEAERLEVLGTIRAATRLPLIMGASATHADDVLRRIDAAMGHAPAAFLVTPPPYLRPSQAALRQFFTAIADGSPAPLVLYDIPARTGVRLELDTLLALAAHPRIVGLKDCGGRVEQTEAVIADGRLQVLCGNDDEWFSTRCLGGAGAIAASAHLRTDLFVAFDAALARGDLATGRALWRTLKPIALGLFEEPSPGPLKAVLAAQGECANELRPPMTTASAGLVQRLRSLVAALPAAPTAR